MGRILEDACHALSRAKTDPDKQSESDDPQLS